LSNGFFGETVSRLVLRAVGKGDVILELGYALLVSNQAGVLTLQKDGVEEALIRNRDLFFVPADQAGTFVECA